MQNEAASLEVLNISKRYGDFVAVDDISFSVGRGTIFGLLGPNGAGKTTTIRMIMNIIIPDRGTISILGRKSTDAAAQHIGYLPEERGLYRKMKVLEHLVFLGEIRGLSNADAKKRAAHWLERLEITGWGPKKVEELSKGMQQKIQFIGCVIHDPDILILDEPFSGLDPVNAHVLRELLEEFRASNRTVIMSTHVMEHAEKLCDEIALINRAKIVLNGKVAEIKRKYSGNRLSIQGTGDTEALRTIPGVIDVVSDSGGISLELQDGFSRGDFLRAAAPAFDFESVVPHETSLDEIFLQVVGGEESQNQMTGRGLDR